MIEAIIAGVFLIPATCAAGNYFVCVGLSLLHRRTTFHPRPATRFAILVPAHNEARSLPATLASLQTLDYPASLVDIVVVADNCTDDTTALARAAGVRVLERHDPARRGKGYALEFALNAIRPTRPDAVLIFDADGELASKALRVFDARFAGGADVVQGSIRTRNAGDGPTGLVAAVGNVLDDAVAAGRDRLGLRVPLRGSNMAFRRDVLERIPWTCHGLTEDAEYSGLLQAAGVRVRFEPQAKARSESPASLNVLARQRQRWCAAMKTSSWLDSKPLVLAHLLLTAAITALAAAMSEAPIRLALGLWLGLIVLMTAAVYAFALHQCGPCRANLLGIPRTVLTLLHVALRRPQLTQWERTRRSAEHELAGRASDGA